MTGVRRRSDGTSTRERAINAPAPLLWLIGAMVAIHVFSILAPDAWRAKMLYLFAVQPFRYGGAEAFLSDALPGGAWVPVTSLVTYTFLHGGWAHLGMNSVWLLAFGAPVMRRIGAGRFFALYFLCGALGAFAHIAVHWGSLTPVIGASAAVSGCMGAAARFAFVWRRGQVTEVSKLASVTDPTVLGFAVIWFVLNALTGLVGTDMGGARLVAWEAHMGGFVGGLALIGLLDRRR